MPHIVRHFLFLYYFVAVFLGISFSNNLQTIAVNLAYIIIFSCLRPVYKSFLPGRQPTCTIKTYLYKKIYAFYNRSL